MFYACSAEPVHSTLLMPSREEALCFPRAPISLALCDHCGFIWNQDFQPGRHRYSVDCEESQGHSPLFTAWLEDLVARLVSRYALRDKTVLEIGCGKGEFLVALCAAGGNRGTGYDPAYVTDRVPLADTTALSFKPEFWQESCGLHDAEVIVCRHTLEHIPDVGAFIRSIRRAIGEQRETLLFFEVPDMLRVLEEGAFQDIYYEHCSYFSADSLAYLFRREGFEVLDLELDFHGQYLCLVAKPVPVPKVEPVPVGTSEIAGSVSRFTEQVADLTGLWRQRLQAYSAEGKSVVLWGGGSKAAAFLNRLDSAGAVQWVIDINPHKHHAFIPGAGQEVFGPESLLSQPADVIIIMNAVYRPEIQEWLNSRGLSPELLALGEQP
ncbi:MAG: class I SAM-dependent methyltransferase [Haliea sp.]